MEGMQGTYYVQKLCQIAEQNHVNRKPAGLKQPLQIPGRPGCSDISVGFATGLPPMGVERQCNTITIYVDRLSKMVHTCPRRELGRGKLPAEGIADLIMRNIFRMHRLLHWTLCQTRDPGFPSAFWEEVTTTLKMEELLHGVQPADRRDGPGAWPAPWRRCYDTS
jgi:hypothetical protein